MKKREGKHIMRDRPNFTTIKTYQEFSQYYWYRAELADICKRLGKEHSGVKKELEAQIKQYFAGNVAQKKVRLKTKKEKDVELTLDTPLLTCGFAFNTRFREFFAQQTGSSSFKFTADMAAAWRKVNLNELTPVCWAKNSRKRVLKAKSQDNKGVSKVSSIPCFFLVFKGTFF